MRELIYEQLAVELNTDPRPRPVVPLPRGPGRHYLRGHDIPTQELPVMGDHHDEDGNGIADGAERPAMTAGQQDHTDPWVYAGEDVDAPQPGEVPDGVA